MGLIKAVSTSLKTTLGDQWKEYFYCESLPVDVLVTKGQKRTGKNSSNKNGSDNIISKGSTIAVADGQCMIIVEQGKVLELAADPGEYIFDSSTEPSIFAESLGAGLLDILKTTWKRLGYGGDTGKDQRVYYFNMKELLDNKFGTMNPVPFRVVDSKIGLDIDVSVRCCGTFSYKICNPILFYTNVCGNVSSEYRRSNLDNQLKSEFISALQPGFGKLSALEIRPSQVMTHVTELEESINEALKEKWSDKRGIEIVSIAISSLTLPKEDEDMIKEYQRRAILRDPGMAGATMVEAQAEALKTAAGNSAGAMQGFVGMGFVNQATGMQQGMNATQYYQMQQQQQAQQAQQQQQQQTAAAKPAANAWTCPSCGKSVTGKFCPECGTKKPEASTWTCKCGAVNTGKFCAECGAKKPGAYKCNKCGWVPSDPSKAPKFCPECGDPFNDEDQQ